jgi:hypothetical protein
VRTRTKIVNGVGYVFAYNYTNASQPVTFTWQSTPASVTESKSGQSYSVSGASWNDTFGPYESRIYVINGAGGSTPPPPPPPPPSNGVSVAFTNPASGATVSGTTTVTAAASGGTGTGYSYRIAVDGTTVYTGTNPSFSWNSTTVTNGARTLTATVTDSANASGTATRSVTVSNGSSSAPADFTVSFNHPASGATVNGAQSVGLATTADWATTKTFTLSVDGTVITSQTLAKASTLWHTWDTTAIPNGTRTLTASVTMNGKTATATLPVIVGNGGTGTNGAGGRLTLGLSITVKTVKSGDTSQVSLTVANPGSSVTADVYAGLVLPPAAGAAVGCPQGDAIAFATPGASTVTVRCLSASTASFPKFASSVSVPGALAATTVPNAFSFVWPSLPAGTYTVFLAFTVPGSLADGTLNAADIITIATDTVTLSP